MYKSIRPSLNPYFESTYLPFGMAIHLLYFTTSKLCQGLVNLTEVRNGYDQS